MMTLITILLTVFLAAIGAVLYAIRGDWLVQFGSTQIARMVWCIPTAGLLAVIGGAWLAFPAALIAAYVGLLNRHAHVMSVGAPMPSPAKGWQGDWLTPWVGLAQPSPALAAVTLAWLGLYRGGLLALSVAYWIPDAWIIAASWAIAHPAAYWIGWRLPVERPHGGELLTGAAVWASIAILLGG
jgi:hypothetical protein